MSLRRPRSFLAVTAAVIAGLAPPAAAAPTDPFFAALPARDTQAPDSLEVRDPDGSVDASTGTAAYKLPIVVPPGRQEMAPSLALSYSSQRPLRGGVAVGWGLDVGAIEKDTSVLNGTAYRVDWNGMNERLIPVTGDPSTTYTQTFRAERDPSFTRFVYVALNQTWTAYTLDGKTHTFGVHNNASRWHLSQSRDRFDNRVVYSYTWTTFTPTTGNTYGEHELTAIEYSSNPTVGLAAHARVEIVRGPLAMCGAPIGAALVHHFGVLRAEGSRPIDSIDVKVKSAPGASWQLRRSHRLVYDPAQLSCGTGSALRYLNRFEVTAYDPAGAATVVPPVTFTYGLPTRALTRTINAPSFGGGERGTSKGPTAMLIDMDSDGWLDRLTVAATDRCNLGIQRGTGIGTFATTTSWRPLPSARWYNSSYPTQLEGCSLSGQVADRGFTLPGTNCRRESVQVTYSFQDWNGDGLVDIVSHMHESLLNTAGGDFPQFIGGPGGTPPPCTNVVPAPERVSTGGLFRLRVQRNLGGLGFDTFTNALLVASPAPMPPSPTQLNTAEVARPFLPSMIDMTGDGLVDVISLISNPGSGDLPPQPGTTPYLYVWPGKLDGTFEPMQSWPLPSWSQQYQVATPNPSQGWFLSPGTLNLNDLDGDGLPDLVVALDTGALAVVRNTGGGFRAPSLLTLGGPVDQARSEFPPAGDLPTSITNGARAFLRQLVDTDADGLPEHLVMGLGAGGVQTAATSRSALHIFGTKYATVRALGAEWEGFEELVVASNGSWHRASAAIDATGDGIVDLVEWNASGAAVIRTDGQDGVVAPRLLARVDNGRGGVTRYEYAPSTDASVVTLAGSYLPARHVVRAIVVEPGAGQPAMTTRYSYSGPRHGTGHYLDNGRKRFLGFATVTSDRDGRFGIGSSRTVQNFTFPTGYDRRALLTEEWTLMLEAPGGAHVPVRMKAITTWEGQVQSGASSFRYTRSTTERICAPGATMSSCVTTPERSHVTTSTWTPYRATPTGPDLHYQETRTEDTATLAPARTTTRTYSVRTTTSEYIQATTQVQELSGATLVSREDTVLDTRFMPNETRRYHDALTIARTQRGFDEVGNLYIEVQPRQVAAGGAGRWTSYDAHRVLVAGGTNELWHTVYETRDIATGELLERRGPNWRYGTDEQGVQGLYFERERSTIDGLGRVVRREATFDPPAGNPSQTYVLRTVETKVYDSPLNYNSTSTVQDTTTGDAILQGTALDGLGRVISTFEHHGIPGLPSAATDYHYDAGGEILQMFVPDPRVDTGAAVTYAWLRDGLGRPTRLTRPDGSGERVEHLGATTRITELDELGHDGGVTRLVDDGRGALREVFEDGNALPTTYGYDALGRMTSMTNADGHLTSLGYDLAGHRTTITRGSRTWRIRYDLDGNPREQEAPFTSGTASDHTTVLEHDAIGRMTRRTPATLGQPLPLRTLLGVGPTMYTYDTPHVGSLGRAQFPFGATAFTYDARGKVRREARTVTPPGASFTIAQHVDRTYDATGAPRDVTWDDGTTWRYVNDRRGDVSEVMSHPPSVSTYTHLAIYNRGVAGMPRSRNTHGHRRDWTYDALGRVLTDRVWWLPTGVTSAERTYGYQGDEIDTVWGHTAGMVADASYSYDTQHRLTGAAGPGDYEADIGYSPAGNVTRARIRGALDVPSRDVTYRYSTLDPQAVEALVAFGADVATMTYDPAGTLRQRTGSLAPALSLTWDGDDQVREATGPGGSERYLYGERGQRIAAIGADGIRVWFAESEAHFTTSGAPLERWLHVAAGEPIARITNGNQVEIQHADALSNLMLAVDFTGAVTASFLYGAYGEVVASTGSEDHRRQWNGKESDVVTGLRHYGFRNYDPLLLRWVSADPAFRLAPDITVEEPQRANLYAYSLNNPMRWLDPDGLNACDAGGDCKVDAPPEAKPGKSQKPSTSGEPTDTTTPSDGRGAPTGGKDAKDKDAAGGKDAAAKPGKNPVVALGAALVGAVTSATGKPADGSAPRESEGKPRESGKPPGERSKTPPRERGKPSRESWGEKKVRVHPRMYVVHPDSVAP